MRTLDQVMDAILQEGEFIDCANIPSTESMQQAFAPLLVVLDHLPETLELYEHTYISNALCMTLLRKTALSQRRPVLESFTFVRWLADDAREQISVMHSPHKGETRIRMGEALPPNGALDALYAGREKASIGDKVAAAYLALHPYRIRLASEDGHIVLNKPYFLNAA